VNVRRYTQGVVAQPRRLVADYITSLMHASVNAVPHIALVSGMLVHNQGHGGLEAAVQGMTEQMEPWAVDALFQGFQGLSEGISPGQYVPNLSRLHDAAQNFVRPYVDTYTLGQLWERLRQLMRDEELPEGLREVASLVEDGRVGQETFNMIQSAALPVRRMFAPSAEDLANVEHVQQMLQDPVRAQRELPLAVNRLLQEGHAAFQGVTQSAAVSDVTRSSSASQMRAYVFEDNRGSLEQGIQDWAGRYYRAITGSGSVPEGGAPAHSEGLEARRTYVRDSMTSILGLAGTAFLARAAFRYASQAPTGYDIHENYEQRGETEWQRGAEQMLPYSRPIYEERPARTEDGEEVNLRIQQPTAFFSAGPRPEPEQGVDPYMMTDEDAPRLDAHGVMLPVDEDVHMEQVQDGLANDPQASRGRVVDQVLRPINRRIQRFDMVDAGDIMERGQLMGARRDEAQDAIDEGLDTLNRIAPNEWHYLRGRLHGLRGSQPPTAYGRHRPNAPFSMFRRSDLTEDDPDARGDAPEALGGDRRMLAPGLGFQPGEAGPRQSPRLQAQRDPVIALSAPDRDE
jgi:hypothetical protein